MNFVDFDGIIANSTQLHFYKNIEAI